MDDAEAGSKASTLGGEELFSYRISNICAPDMPRTADQIKAYCNIDLSAVEADLNVRIVTTVVDVVRFSDGRAWEKVTNRGLGLDSSHVRPVA